MTAEEKAEEYIFHTYYVKDLTKEDKDLLREEVRMMHRRKIKAYLNGLAEGKPKWHDLRKDPNDLPKHSGLYCVQCGEVREFVKEEKSWFTVNFKPCLNRTEETYLWCELPKFEEE